MQWFFNIRMTFFHIIFYENVLCGDIFTSQNIEMQKDGTNL